MAAAPNYPMPEVQTYTVAIDDNFNATPPGLIVNPGDTVNFENSSGVDITITFLANYTSPSLSPNLVVPNGNPNGPVGFTTPGANPNYAAAANYNILVNGVAENEYPYVIQVGVGPIYVVFPIGVQTPYNYPTVAVPLGSGARTGKLNMGPNLASNSLTIYFTTNPFSTPITAPGGTHSVAAGAAAGPYTYTTVVPEDQPGPGGKVIIQST
jgi:hypothetical protein